MNGAGKLYCCLALYMFIIFIHRLGRHIQANKQQENRKERQKKYLSIIKLSNIFDKNNNLTNKLMNKCFENK